MTQIRRFQDFKIGDCVSFDKEFTIEDFHLFSKLSADQNPLHHDQTYAETTSFGQTIVPMHMTIAPLSMIAGMVFPGEPSLYLGHEIKASKPVFYNKKLVYSAKITGVYPANNILTVRVLCLQDNSVVLDADMKIQSLKDEWQTPSPLPIQSASTPRHALILGSTGAIGRATALQLAQAGWNLLLQSRGTASAKKQLESDLSKLGGDVSYEFLDGDLSDPSDREKLVQTLSKYDRIGLVLHCACPPIDAPLAELVEVNYQALKEISQALLAQFYRNQYGHIAFLSSVATEKSIAGWENYSAVKAMASNYVSSFNRSHSFYNIHGSVILLGLVKTDFSSQVKSDIPALSRHEAAHKITQALSDDSVKGSNIWIDVNQTQTGQSGFHAKPTIAPVPSSNIQTTLQEQPSTAMAETSSSNAKDIVSRILRRKLRLEHNDDVTQAALGLSAGWDSLTHIEIILELEKQAHISFGSHEVDKLTSFDMLCKKCEEKLSEREPS